MRSLFAAGIATSILTLTGCVSSVVAPGAPAAQLTILVLNDSTGTMVVRGASATMYANEQCEKEKRLEYGTMMTNNEALKEVSIPAGAPLTMAVTTLNGQVARGNWGCGATATFVPAGGMHYKAVLETTKDSRYCSLTITDASGQKLPTTQPQYSCARTLAGIPSNGKGYEYDQRPLFKKSILHAD